MEITLKDYESKGAAIATENDVKAGEMTYSVASPTLIIIDHTEVSPTFNGKGVGKQMLYAIVEMAREKHKKILPLCPYAASVFKKADDIKDVLHQ